MLRGLAQVESYLDDHWPMLWPEAQAWGQSLSVDWRARPVDEVFAVLRRTGRCPADWICEFGKALANQDLRALARRSRLTQRHLERLRKGSVTSAGVTRPTNPTCLTYCKVMCAVGRGLPLVRLADESFELAGPSENRKPDLPDEVRLLKTSRQAKRRSRSRHPFLRNARMPWHKPRETVASPQVAPQTAEVTPQVAPQTAEVTPQVAPQTAEVTPQVAPQTVEVAPPRGPVTQPRRQVARPKRRRKTAPRTASRRAAAQSRMHTQRNRACGNGCPKGHDVDKANHDIETRKKIKETALISQILGSYDSCTGLCGEDGGGMTRRKDEMASMIAGEPTAPMSDALALVLQKLAELQAQTAREQLQAIERSEQRHREMMVRADERQERAEQRQREMAEKLAEQQLQETRKGGALTLELVSQMSQDLTAAVKDLKADVPALSRRDRLLDEVMGMARSLVKVYVEKNGTG